MRNIMHSLRVFWGASWIYFAIALVLLIVQGYVASIGRQPNEFQTFQLWGMPFWTATPTLFVLLVGGALIFHGFKIVHVESNTKFEREE